MNKINKLEDMPKKTIDKYRFILPEMIIDFWEKYGIATLLNGYLTSINPDDFKMFISETFVLGEEAIPVFVTAFGDIIVLTRYNNEYNMFYIVKYKDGYGQAMLGASKFFFQLLSDDYFLSKYFEISLYQKAIQRLGNLNYMQCFTFVPLLALGGSKKVMNLEKGGIIEYLMIITQFVGNIDNIKEN
ncbi:DUF1851 domain-containing protein [Carnobacteriaceae bacterium zg-ZUI240]|nr:DUF1851 domain-containing protein [Carnobacteriaceae bacterium zg-ZUI240]